MIDDFRDIDGFLAKVWPAERNMSEVLTLLICFHHAWLHTQSAPRHHRGTLISPFFYRGNRYTSTLPSPRQNLLVCVISTLWPTSSEGFLPHFGFGERAVEETVDWLQCLTLYEFPPNPSCPSLSLPYNFSPGRERVKNMARYPSWLHGGEAWRSVMIYVSRSQTV